MPLLYAKPFSAPHPPALHSEKAFKWGSKPHVIPHILPPISGHTTVVAVLKHVRCNVATGPLHLFLFLKFFLPGSLHT